MTAYIVIAVIQLQVAHISDGVLCFSTDNYYFCPILMSNMYYIHVLVTINF